MELWNIGMMI